MPGMQVSAESYLLSQLEIPESGIGKFWLVESGIPQIFVVESGILGFGIRNIHLKESVISQTIGIRNPSSSD